MISLALAFLAGLMTILSPCVLPLAPIVIAASRARGLAGPFALAGGLAVSFGLFGGLLAAAGREAGDSAALRYVSAVLLSLAGLAMLWPAAQIWLEARLAPLSAAGGALERRLPAGLMGQAALGAVLALAWAPCAGPALGAAFALAAGGGSLAFAMLTMAVYALGTAGALLAVGFGLGRLASLGRGRARHAAAAGRIIFGVALMAVGLGVLTGWDRQVQALANAAAPEWLTLFATQF